MLKMIQVNNLQKGDNSYKRKIAIRFIILSLTAFFLAQVIPTLAEEQNLATELTEQVAPTDLAPSQSPSPASETATAPNPSPSASVSDSPTGTSTLAPARPANSRGMIIQVPQEISVDPRAQIVRIPNINVSGPEYLLLCINTVNTVVDVLTKGAPDNVKATNLFISGDLSSTLAIAAPAVLVNSVFNAQGGAKVSALGRSLAGQQIQIGFLATDKQAEDSTLCPEVLPENRRVISIKAIGVGIGMKKGEVTLKR
jgi:hypothetical protein